MNELYFLETIADNLERNVISNETIRVPEQFFKDNFIPYIIGEKRHPNIVAKLMELTNNGLSSISLMDEDGNLVYELPSIFPKSLSVGDNFDSDLYKAENKLIPEHATKAIGSVLGHHLHADSNHSWDEYLSRFSTDSEAVNETDDDDFEIIY